MRKEYSIALLAILIGAVGFLVLQRENVGHMGSHGEEEIVLSERAFLEHMIPHHEEAIFTAQYVLARGATTEGMKDLLEGIVAAQTSEVALMKEKYEEWYQIPYSDLGVYRPMMRNLSSFEGAELDLVFLHDMTMHHMGAIMMARAVQNQIEHEEIAVLSASIITNQTKEIETMRILYQDIADKR